LAVGRVVSGWLVSTILIVQMIAPLVLALALLATKSRVVHYIGIGLP
jgi:hypothetical protein